ncbi:MAG TPA: FAD-dependent monooxygenase [Leptospiraceae bacterium]|nr:FAD-dependent monooxygenase [Leptospiraceae bacterium]HMW07602.1 FAD-dependent monooxygenase [Leptospiraceae bacterium]HMX33020.1 FAD-dependent monooxygenase [Leptospiraceae bacterium]HMY33183.1 FAD-dependent monooxygenase [Leptospiraceae bacterium]HMZ66360.1 FAD-dependent monooxygenase [Leptospiraceae bacterium]
MSFINQMKTEVLIIGGGPTGMVASIALSKQGISNILVEKRDKPMLHPKAHELSARSIEILDSLGIPFSEIQKEASDHETASRILFCNTINEEFGRIDLRENGTDEKYADNICYPHPYFNISQVELEKIIRNYMLRCKEGSALYGYQWESFKEGREWTSSDVFNTVTGERIKIKSKFVICADGATSKGREALQIKMIGPEKIQDFANAYFINDLTPYLKTKAKLYWILNPEAPGVLIAHHPEKRWVYHVPIETPYEKLEDFTVEYFSKRIKKALNLKENIPIHITSISSWRMTAQVAEKFRAGSIFLAGDAAHRFPPTGGLGMNSGIADVHNLAWKLAAVIKGFAGNSLLDTYEAERKPVIERNCFESKKNSNDILDVPASLGLDIKKGRELARILHSNFIHSLPKSWGDKLKSILTLPTRLRLKIFLRNSENFPKLKTIIKKQTGHFDRIGLDLGFSYKSEAIISDGISKEEELEVSNYFPTTKPGHRFPHFWLNSQLSSQALLSYKNFTLILGSKENKWGSALKKINLDIPITVSFLSEYNENLGELYKKAEIESTGAILVRPDGQVAYRKQFLSKGEDPYKILESIFQTILSSRQEKINKDVAA